MVANLNVNPALVMSNKSVWFSVGLWEMPKACRRNLAYNLTDEYLLTEFCTKSCAFLCIPCPRMFRNVTLEDFVCWFLSSIKKFTGLNQMVMETFQVINQQTAFLQDWLYSSYYVLFFKYFCNSLHQNVTLFKSRNNFYHVTVYPFKTLVRQSQSDAILQLTVTAVLLPMPYTTAGML